MENRKYNLLIVDDEVMVIRSIMRVLANEEYNIYHTTDPTSTAELISNTPIDVIISDQRMPDMTGLELLMQAREISPSSIRILMSGYSDIDIVIAAINDGHIYKYITKPWDNDKLVKIISDAIKLKVEDDEKAAILAYRLESKESWNAVIARMNNKLEQQKDNTVNAFLKVLKAKDFNLYKHSFCVSETSVLLAEMLGLTDEQKETIRYAGLLHDIGKIAIRDKIMYKAGYLDDDEYEEMKYHPVVSADILREVDFLVPIADIVEQHHEKTDGGGYPKGLGQDEILPEAQIIAVADTFEALREDRVYRAGMSVYDALRIIQAEQGTKYSREVVLTLEQAVLSESANCINSGCSIN